MDLLSASAAFTKFERHCLEELLQGVEHDDAQALVLEQWESMDEEAKSKWVENEAPVEAPHSVDAFEPLHLGNETSEVTVIDEVLEDAALAPAEPVSARGPAPRRRKRSAVAPAPRKAPRASEAAVEVAAAAGEGIRWLKPGEASLEESSDEDSEDHDEEDQADQESKQLAFNRSAVVRQGGKHPDWLTEPAAVAEISLPPLSPDEVVYLPAEVAEKRLLSSPQLESVAYAARRFRAHLPSGVRAGYYLGDGTGCGKGRVIAALVWHLWNSGAKRHVWLSASSDLLEDATRDFCDLGADLPLCTLSSLPYGSISTGPGLDEEGNGIIFASYHLLVASKASASGVPTSENSRLVQLIDWLRRGKGGACGLIALDEAHRTKNVMNSKTSQGSKSGLCALELQRACPLAAVLYASATGATELRHLGYLERLGLWGRGRPHGSFEELRDAVEGGGFAAMELLAMTMRAEGMLSCRSLSFKGASFRLVPVSLESLCNTYSKACDFWQESLKLILRLLKAKTREVKQKRLKHSTELKENPLHLRYFWGAQQQFFRQLLICTKVETAVSLATSAQLRGESVVFAMWSTGEAITEAVANREGDRAAAAAGFASAPKEVALRMLKELRMGAREIDRAEQTLEKWVAELTGRTRRLVYNELTGETRFEERGEGANLQELRAFQTGQKHVAIVTEAASAGISLHCDRRLPEDAQRPRYMISIEMPWEADKALQQLGRVHRSNQRVTEERVPPRFAFVVTDLGGEVKDGAYAEFVESWITRKRHNQLMWLPSSSSTLGPLSPLGGLVSLMIVVGDSYADDIDMGFQCWPTQLSKALHAPVLNVARGGSESSHIHSQLERAHLWTKEQQLQVNLSEVLLVLHTGGNDALHSLLKPWMFVSLISDLYSLRSEAVEKKSVELSFPKKLSIVILREVDEFLERAAALGHRKVVISTLPIVSSLPLARLLVHVLVPGADPGFVTETLEAVGGSINRHLQEQCVVLAQKHGVEAWIFQEGDSLDSLAKGAEAATHGVFSAVKLALKRIRRIIWALASQESLDGHEFWHDGHHPAARAHEQLAAEVLELLTTVRFVSTVARRLRILGAMMRGDRNSAHGAVQSLATFDIQNRYGRQALARLFELLRSGQEPEVAFSFLQFSDRKSKGSSWRSWADFKKIALKALDLIGLRPDTEDKYEESLAESKNLNVFLNRLLMLEPSIQNALFDAVAELYMHLVDLDRASGAYDGGPEILDRRRGTKAEVRLVHREVLFKDPVTGAETAYARLQLDRGMSWEKANEVLESRQRGRAGFYWCPRAPSPLVLAVPRPRLHGLRAGAASDDDESDADLDLHWPQGPPAEHGWEQHVSSAKLRKGDFFHKAGADELPNVSTIWKRLHGSSADLAGRWEDEHVLTGSILSTWAVLGTAISGASTYSRLKVQRIPLVRAKLPDGGAIVGVRVRHERLQEEADQLGVRKLSAELEAFLRTQPNQSAAWRNWAGAHQVLMANGLIPEGAVGMQQAREAFEDLERNGKVDIQPDSVQLREKPKGSGWYIPPTQEA
ncbi:unnamed protein product [Durusdinium trenchii]|uniref:Uncharacterized protein n=2 Tax=Durusdinium trenchii TaxID=1381693 RepID=A0ABP0P455_9DINO